MNKVNDEVSIFIATYLIPVYERKYVDSNLRRDFYEIVDEAEADYREDK